MGKRFLLLIIFILFVFTSTYGGVIFINRINQTATGGGGGGIVLEGSDSNFTTAQSASLTISSFGCSATNDYLVVAATIGAGSMTSIVYATSESLSVQHSETLYSGSATFLYSAIPSAASGDIVITPSTSTSISARAFCLSNVHQSTPVEADDGTNSASATSIANSITTITDNAMIISAAGLNTDSISGDAVQDGDQSNYLKVTPTNYVIHNQLSSTEVVPTAGAESNGYSWTETSVVNFSQIAIRPAS